MSTPDHADAPDIRAYLEIRTASPSGWAPDGARLLVASDVPGTVQAYRLDLRRVRERPAPVETLAPVTRLPEPVGAGYLPAPVADGAQLLVAVDDGGNERHQLYLAPDEPPAPITDPSDLAPLVVDPQFIHRPGGVTRDGRWLAYATNRGDGVAFDTWVRDLATGEERCVWASGGWSQPLGFSPDGRWLAVAEPTTLPGDNRLHLVDLAHAPVPALPGAEGVTEVAPHHETARVGAPSWLPDSSAFFFAADVGRERAAIARATPDGAWTYAVEPGWDADCLVDWGGRHLLVVTNDDGRTRAELRDPASLAVTAEVPLPGDGVASAFSFTRDGRHLVFGYTSPLVPGDVWSVDTDELEALARDGVHPAAASTRLTASPCEVDPATFVDADLVRFASFDGVEVPAFVLRPTRATQPAPVVVVIHGGPESQYRPSFSPLAQYLVARGYAVVAPNVRGSTGYGKTYQSLDDVERRLDSVADLAALHEWIATQPDLDSQRVALYGGSYGGYMVLAGLAFQPERWAAGIDIVGMSNLVTFLENTSSWRRAYREREYGSLAEHRDVLAAASPINQVDEIRAPLLIVHGANDPRVPLSEAEQIHAALTARDVRCDLLVYDDEGHGLAKLDNRVDAYRRAAAFLDEVLAEEAPEP